VRCGTAERDINYTKKQFAPGTILGLDAFKF